MERHWNLEGKRMTELVEWQRRGKTFIGTPQQFVDELLYASYRNNRQAHPQRQPSEWAVVFPMWEQLEQRFQHDHH